MALGYGEWVGGVISDHDDVGAFSTGQVLTSLRPGLRFPDAEILFVDTFLTVTHSI
jgi:hypothetical protein